ncbi:hypothetical protein GQ42DRAFT_163662 [Ramicandelaber brevisporus]|nr:hypothetical protein GQ42DRAFT_163662 [Ramicandelaber brevisporus]
MSDNKATPRKRGRPPGSTNSSTPAARSAKRAAPSLPPPPFEPHFIDGAISECTAKSPPPPATDSDTSLIRDTRHRSWWKTKANVLGVKDVAEPDNLLLYSLNTHVYSIGSSTHRPASIFESTSATTSPNQYIKLHPFTLERCGCEGAVFKGISWRAKRLMSFDNKCRSYPAAHSFFSSLQGSQITAWKCEENDHIYMFDSNAQISDYMKGFGNLSDYTKSLKKQQPHQQQLYQDPPALKQYINRWLEFVFVVKSCSLTTNYLSGNICIFLKIGEVKRAMAAGEIVNLQPLFDATFCNQLSYILSKNKIDAKPKECRKAQDFKNTLAAMESKVTSGKLMAESIIPNSLPYSHLSILFENKRNVSLSDKYDETDKYFGRTRIVQLGNDGPLMDITTGILYPNSLVDTLPVEESRSMGFPIFYKGKNQGDCFSAVIEHIASTRATLESAAIDYTEIPMPVKSTLITMPGHQLAGAWVSAICKYNSLVPSKDKLRCTVISYEDRSFQVHDIADVDIVLLVTKRVWNPESNTEFLVSQHMYCSQFEYMRNKLAASVESDSTSARPLYVWPHEHQKHVKLPNGTETIDYGDTVDPGIQSRVETFKKINEKDQWANNGLPTGYYTDERWRDHRVSRQARLEARDSLPANPTGFVDYKFRGFRFKRLICCDPNLYTNAVLGRVINDYTFDYGCAANVRFDLIVHNKGESTLTADSDKRFVFENRLPLLYGKDNVTVPEFELVAKQCCIRF